MLTQIKSLLLTDTGKDTAIVFVGTLANVIIGGLFFIIAPRVLGPASYGLFSVVMATGLMAANFANFGIDTGILKFTREGAKEQNDKILQLALKAYLAIGVGITTIGLLISEKLALILSAPEISTLLKISFSGVIFILLTNFFIAALQSQKQFFKASLVNISSNFTRLVILAIGAYFATINLYFLTALFFFVTIVSVIVGKLFVSLDFLKVRDDSLEAKNFFGYNFWVAASLAISTIPIDNYLLIKIAGPIATGLYAAPMKILTTTYQFAGGFSRVLASRFSSFDSNKKAQEFSLKASGLVILVFIALIIASLLAHPLTTLFLGSQFRESIAIFQILAIGMAFFFADTIPMSLILYYFGKSKVAFYVTVWHYVIFTLLLYILIPQYQAIGASAAFTVSEIITFLTLITYAVFKFRKNDQR